MALADSISNSLSPRKITTMALDYSYAKATAAAVNAAGFCFLGTEDMVMPVAVLIGGTFVATVKVEVSNDPEAASPTWTQFGADVTAAGTVKVDIPVKAVRLRVSAYTSGTVAGYISGARGTT